MACSAANSRFDADETSAGDEGSSSGSAPSSEPDPDAGSEGASAHTSAASGSSGSADGTGTEGTEETEGSQANICAADLYAISPSGELSVIDVEAGTQVVVITDPALMSWALATDRETGTIAVIALGQPEVHLIDPVDFQVDPTPWPIPGPDPGDIARAGFDASGRLWAGTAIGSDFLGFVVGNDEVETLHIGGTGNLGDLVFLATGQGLVLDDAGDGHLIELATGDAIDVSVGNMPAGVRFTGVAFDRNGQLWASDDSPSAQLFPVEIDLSAMPPAIGVGAPLLLDAQVADLASIRVSPAGC